MRRQYKFQEMNKIQKGIRYIIRTSIWKPVKNLVRFRIYEVISRLIKENNFYNYVEVGVWRGETLFNVARENKQVKIYGVDDYNSNNYKGYIAANGEVMANIDNETYDKIRIDVLNKATNFKNVFIIIKNSLAAAKTFNDDSLDIVFIDGLHNYKNVYEDITAWLPKIREGGILCGHDFSLKHFSVIKAVGDLIGYDNIKILPDVSIWIFKKTADVPKK